MVADQDTIERLLSLADAGARHADRQDVREYREIEERTTRIDRVRQSGALEWADVHVPSAVDVPPQSDAVLRWMAGGGSLWLRLPSAEARWGAVCWVLGQMPGVYLHGPELVDDWRRAAQRAFVVVVGEAHAMEEDERATLRRVLRRRVYGHALIVGA